MQSNAIMRQLRDTPELNSKATIDGSRTGESQALDILRLAVFEYAFPRVDLRSPPAASDVYSTRYSNGFTNDRPTTFRVPLVLHVVGRQHPRRTAGQISRSPILIPPRSVSRRRRQD